MSEVIKMKNVPFYCSRLHREPLEREMYRELFHRPHLRYRAEFSPLLHFRSNVQRRRRAKEIKMKLNQAVADNL